MRYECDQCGACCKALIIEIEWVDYLREPSLRDVTTPFRIADGECFLDDNDELIPEEDADPYMAGGGLACGKNHPCPKLGADNLCQIYQTRPTCCVLFAAGSEQCQEARRSCGLESLQPAAKGGV